MIRCRIGDFDCVYRDGRWHCPDTVVETALSIADDLRERFDEVYYSPDRERHAVEWVFSLVQRGAILRDERDVVATRRGRVY